jgi:hypothetical protein
MCVSYPRGGLVGCHFAGAGFDMVAHILNEGFAESLNYQAVHMQKLAWSASGPVSGS